MECANRDEDGVTNASTTTDDRAVRHISRVSSIRTVGELAPMLLGRTAFVFVAMV